jgi:hypothetical protein
MDEDLSRWGAYARTIVIVEDLQGARWEIHPAAPGDIDSWPASLAAPLYLLTAWDPGDQRPGEAVNRLRQAALGREVRELASQVWSGVGYDEASGHREEGVMAAGLTATQALDIGRRHDQDAIFEWTPECWSILSCRSDERHQMGWRLVLKG